MPAARTARTASPDRPSYPGPVRLQQLVLAPADRGQRQHDQQVKHQEMPRHASPGVGNEEITLSPDRLDALRAVGIVAELLAQMRDTDVEHPIEAIVLAPVELLEQRSARLNLRRHAREVDEQVELIARQRDGSAVQITERAAVLIISCPNRTDRVLGSRRTPCCGVTAPDSREQDPRLDRLDDVVVGAELQAQHVIDVVVARREYQNRGWRTSGPQLLADRKPVLPGQPRSRMRRSGVSRSTSSTTSSPRPVAVTRKPLFSR